MAKRKTLNKKTKNSVIEFLKILNKKGYQIDRALVFGSYAKGNPKPWSDIDLCLVSKEFRGDTFRKAVDLSLLADKINTFIELHLFHTSELKDKYYPLAEEIRKYGIEVKV